MRIAGVAPNSFVDFPGKLAMVVFTAGCNYNCYYCHNRAIIRGAPSVLYSPEVILQDLERKRNFLDGVVISGGEPTLQGKLPEFLSDVKQRTGLAVKLDTNGSRPDDVRELVEAGLVDYVAMDVKAPPEKYADVCLCDVDVDAVRECIDYLRNGSVLYEFRMTFLPDLTEDDVVEVARWIGGGRLFALQQYRVVSAVLGFDDARLGLLPHGTEAVREAAKRAEPFFEEVVVRGI